MSSKEELQEETLTVQENDEQILKNLSTPRPQLPILEEFKKLTPIYPSSNSGRPIPKHGKMVFPVSLLQDYRRQHQADDEDDKEIKLDTPITPEEFAKRFSTINRNLPPPNFSQPIKREIPLSLKALLFARYYGPSILLTLGVASMMYLAYKYGFSGSSSENNTEPEISENETKL